MTHPLAPSFSCDGYRARVCLMAAAVIALFAATGCSRRVDLQRAAGPDGRVPVLVVVEPSAIPRFTARHEVGPGDVVREARAMSKGLQSRTTERASLGSTLEQVVTAPALEDLTDTSAILASHMSGRWSKQRTLRPPDPACVLQGAQPETPSSCDALPLVLRVRVRAVRFDATPQELQLRTFIADASLTDRTKRRTVWSGRCDLRSIDLPEVPGAASASEVNQILERAAQVCAEKLEIALRSSLKRPKRAKPPKQG